MERKTKKKRVEKRAARKKKDTDSSESKASASKKKKANKRATLTGTKKPEERKSHVAPSYEQVQLRAYFISEQRRNVGIAGDEHGDWVRAERELREELSIERVSLRG
jgi:hypothetical protein